MLSKATLLHLRIPFSLYLMPVFCFALRQPVPQHWASVSAAANSPFEHPFLLLCVFIIIHIFLYPASNGYNSYYDKDEGSIGGLENPPPVNKELLYTSLIFDLIAIALGFLVHPLFALNLLIYGLVSKAYSHPAIRLKKYPIISLLTAALFQGAFTYIMVYQAIYQLPFEELIRPEVIVPALLSSFMILGFYPMTQVYQHEEDSRRGDRTFSLLVGIKGTFIFCGLVFLLADLAFYFYFLKYFSLRYFLLFEIFLAPVVIYFISWFLRVLKDERQADFRSTMWLNRVSSWSLILCFLWMAVWQHGLPF